MGASERGDTALWPATTDDATAHCQGSYSGVRCRAIINRRQRLCSECADAGTFCRYCTALAPNHYPECPKADHTTNKEA